MLTQVGPARPQALLPGPSFAPSAADRTCASGSTGGRGARGGPDAWSVRVLALGGGGGYTPCRSPSLRPPGTASFPASNNARGRAGRARNSPACVCLRSRLRRSGRGFPSARRGRTGVHIRKAAPGNAVTGREIQPHPVGRRRPPRSLTTLGLPPHRPRTRLHLQIALICLFTLLRAPPPTAGPRTRLARGRGGCGKQWIHPKHTNYYHSSTSLHVLRSWQGNPRVRASDNAPCVGRCGPGRGSESAKLISAFWVFPSKTLPVLLLKIV